MPRRRPLTKAELLARMPRALRPRLRHDQVTDLALCHNSNLDAIARGDAGEQVLWDFIGSVLTWWRAAQLLDAGLAEMDEQMQVATRLLARYRKHGVVRFDGRDLQLARDGVIYMDQLAELVDRPTAEAAADYSEEQPQVLVRGMSALPSRELDRTQAGH